MTMYIHRKVTLIDKTVEEFKRHWIIIKLMLRLGIDGGCRRGVGPPSWASTPQADIQTRWSFVYPTRRQHSRVFSWLQILHDNQAAKPSLLARNGCQGMLILYKCYKLCLFSCFVMFFADKYIVLPDLWIHYLLCRSWALIVVPLAGVSFMLLLHYCRSHYSTSWSHQKVWRISC